MGSKRVFAISRRRRGFFGRVVVFSGALGVLILAIAGCGSSGEQKSDAASERAADVEVLNPILGQEMTTIDAYKSVFPILHGEALALAQQFRGQAQAHLDAVTETIRASGGETEAEADELESPGPKTREEALLLVYDEENAGLGQALSAVRHLNTPAPRMLAGSLAASHAQHLAVLRQLLGADLAESVPGAFDTGNTAAPLPPEKAR